MRNILLFLHGKGATQNAHQDFVGALARRFDAELMTLNAPFAHKQGYSWFGKTNVGGEMHLNEASFEYSLGLIEQKILTLGVPLEQIIVCGHSQGGAMAIAMGLMLPLKKVISICGDIPFDVPSVVKMSAAEFVWVEGGQDIFLSSERKKSYQKLLGLGLNFCYLIDENTEHDCFSEGLVDKL